MKVESKKLGDAVDMQAVMQLSLWQRLRLLLSGRLYIRVWAVVDAPVKLLEGDAEIRILGVNEPLPNVEERVLN